MRVYIAGPMTGLPGLNYEAFAVAALKLRSCGHEVESPAENPAPESGAWADWMRLSLAQVLRSDVVATLDGWENSRGAKLEVLVAKELGVPVVEHMTLWFQSQ